MNIGVVFRPQMPPEDLPAVVSFAEDAGLPELWFWEDCFLESGVSMATAALAWTTRLRVGVGLFPVPLRNPALLAMELATLARLFPERSIATVGHGVPGWMRQVGGGARSPMTLLSEYTDALRDLLDGRTVDVRGSYVHLERVTLEWPPHRRPELLVGARGPRTLSLAAERSDGVLLDSVADVAMVRSARELMVSRREELDLSGEPVVSVYTEIDQPAESRHLVERVQTRVAALADAGADRVVLHGSAMAPDPRPLIEALREADLIGVNAG